MKARVFNRNVRAREQLELFLLSAISSLLLIRFFLSLTGYPQIGGGGFHVAHMLWGGLLLTAANIMMLGFLGLRVQRLSAFVGGIGFGAFIDELGKFITSNNNYFFQPTVGIIYAIFVILYLTFNFLSRQQRLTSREYQLNALMQLEEAIVHDMDPTEKRRAHELLERADHRSPLTRQLQLVIDNVELVPEDSPRNITILLHRLDRIYTRFWKSRSSHPLVRTFFIVESLIFALAISWGIFLNLDDIRQLLIGAADYDHWMILCQVVSSLVAASFALSGGLYLAKSRAIAFEQFRRATLINLFLTEFFIFSRVEFRALPGFVFNVIILLLVTYIIHLEQRQGATAKTNG